MFCPDVKEELCFPGRPIGLINNGCDHGEQLNKEQDRGERNE